MFLEHALLVSDVMVALTLACRKRAHHRLIPAEELRSPNVHQSKRKTFRWKVTVKGSKKLGVVPDGVFAVEFTGDGRAPERRFLLLEADRGTMPILRKNFSQTSMYRKLRAYEATWSQSVLKRRFGINRFRVMTVTTSAGRVESLVNACSQLERGKGLFLFAHRDVLSNLDLLSAPVWRPGSGKEPEGLLS
jgi:hypothetical protein